MGTLFIVATPIGNLEDITLRAVRILKECDYVLCEDTRVTGKLLSRHDISTPTRRYDAHTSKTTHEKILADLESGKNIALVSDAGTPGISDPGVLLVSSAREADIKLEVIPGPSAVTAAVSLAGFSGNQFSFLGFAPQKKGRQTFFDELANYAHPAVFFESTHRISKTLGEIAERYPQAKIYLARELTKIYEEMLVGTAGELQTVLESDMNKQKGEFVLIFDGRK